LNTKKSDVRKVTFGRDLFVVRLFVFHGETCANIVTLTLLHHTFHPGGRMRTRLPAALVSVFFVLVISLNACTPQATQVPSSTPDTVSTLIASAMPPAATSTEPAKPTKLSATLSELTGNVEIKQADQGAFSPASTDSFLDVNGQVQTGDDGRVRLDISTGTIVRVAPASIFTLVSNEPADGSMKTGLSLLLGKLYVILNGGSLEVETPTGTAAVRGSFLSVNYDPTSGEVRITCLEGHCSLTSDGGTVEITAGQTAVITGMGQPPQVGEMSEEDIQDWLNNNPEAQLVVDALTTEGLPAIVASPPVIVYGAVATKKPPREVTQPTAGPSLVPAVVIGNIIPSSSVVGEPLNIAVYVTPSAGGPMPTGTVKVRANTAYFCTATLDSTGTANCIGGIPSAGVYDVTADYLGDTSYLSASSPTMFEFSASPASTSTTLVSHSPFPSLVGTSVTFTTTVDVMSPGAGTPFGSVTFSDGDGTNYCPPDTSAPWQCTYTFSIVGQYPVVAEYSGDANFYSSISTSVGHDVLPDNNTQFSNPLGPMAAMLGAAQCNQFYGVDALDVGGLNKVELEYSVNDNTFASPTRLALTKVTDYTWETTTAIPATYPDTVYWRFVATDGASNQIYFGNGVPYATGNDAYYFNLDIGVTCP
jgi:hypothetical protein